MSTAPLRAGKLPPALLAELLGEGPPLPTEVVLGPGLGEDACAIDLPAGTLIAATDPITLTGEDVGAYAVQINANDVAVMGVRPRWFLATILLPLGGADERGTRESDVRSLFARMRAALADLDVALVGGHTEVTAAVRQPVVVGQMLGHAESRSFVKTGGLRPGDLLVQVGSVPIEGAAVLANECAGRLAALPTDTLDAAKSAAEDPGISVVSAALFAATRLGAVALHDPTEGGLSSGLYEMAEASGVSLRINADAVAWFEPGIAVCRALGVDPWGALASGALLAGFPGEREDETISALTAGGHRAVAIGRAHPGSGVTLSTGQPLPRFDRDEVARFLEDASGPAPP